MFVRPSWLRFLSRMLLVLALVGGWAHARAAALTTTTTLAVTSNGIDVTSVEQGAVVTLTATVTSNGGAVAPGEVKFCDATVPYCTDIHLLGVAQLTKNGTASIQIVPGLGQRSYIASFVGTNSNAASKSVVQPITITSRTEDSSRSSALRPATVAPGQNQSTSLSLTDTQGTNSVYTFNATLSSLGTVLPTGTISFENTSYSNAVIGSVNLNASAAGISYGNGAAFQSPDASIVTVGDLNHDGIPDIVSTGDGPIEVNLGNGDGTFRSPVAYSPSQYSISGLVLADVNGDGNLDIVAYSNGSLYVYPGNGDGTFKTTTSCCSNTLATWTGIFGSSGVHGIVVADINGDGKPDVFGVGGTSLIVSLGNGDGTFSASTTAIVPAGSGGVAYGDFNGDGKVDLVVQDQNCNTSADSSCQSITILYGNGDGTFRKGSTYPLEDGVPLTPAVADFNGDGKVDIVAFNNQNDSGSSGVFLGVFLGNGDGTFQPQSLYSVDPKAPSASTIVISDFNVDGHPDIEVTNVNESTASILYGNGDGTFQPRQVFSCPPTLGQVQTSAAGDFNVDGRPDLAIAGYGGTGGRILLNEQTEQVMFFNAAIYTAAPNSVDAVYSGDSGHAASTSNALSLSETVVASNTSITLSSNSVPVGTPVTVTITVTVNATEGSPAGTVSLYTTYGALLATVTTDSTGVTSTTVTRPAGTILLYAVFTPQSPFTATSTSPNASVTFTDTPIIHFTTPSPIAYGTPLNVNQFNVTVTNSSTGIVPGTLSYSPMAGTILPVGQQTVTVTFTPSDTTIYSTVSAQIPILVTKGTSTLNWSPPAAITYGTALSATQLDATATPTGNFVYAPPSGTVLAAGQQTLNVTFTPTDATDYASATGSTTLTVKQAPLTVTAANASRQYGATNPTLSATLTGVVNNDSLTATASTSASSTSGVGSYPIVPTVSGAALSNYTVTPVNGTLTVTQAGSSAALMTSASSVGSGASVTFTAKVSSATTGTPTGNVQFLNGTTVLGSGTLSSGVATFTTSTLAVANYSVTASYQGDTNFTGSVSSAVAVVVAAPDFSLSVSPASLSIAQGQSGTATFSVTPVGGYSQAVSFACSGLPLEASCSFSPASVTPHGGPVNSVLTITTTAPTALLKQDVAPWQRGRGLEGAVAAALLFGWLVGWRKRRLAVSLSLFIVLGAVLLLPATGCGGSTSNSGGSTPTNPGTPTGADQVTVTASSSGSGSTQHTATLTVTITP